MGSQARVETDRWHRGHGENHDVLGQTRAKSVDGGRLSALESVSFWDTAVYEPFGGWRTT